MNVLFQATLPLPHLLYEKVQGAKDEIKFMFGQEPLAECVRKYFDTRIEGTNHDVILDAGFRNYFNLHGSLLLPRKGRNAHYCAHGGDFCYRRWHFGFDIESPARPKCVCPPACIDFGF